MKPCILLQTDFSLTWSAVASMKGVIKIVDPSLDVQDICHEIKSFDPWEASMSLNTVEPYWPKGSIFVSVVDPGVGTKRKACVALLADGNYVVTPDNGTLTHLFHRVGVKEIREIDEKVNRYKAQEEVSVFHGRDIFAYCAARLASGLITFEQVGEKYPVEEVVICEEYEKKPVLGQCSASGFIQSGLKHFGGIQVNITNEEWKQCGFQLGDVVHTVIRHNGEMVFEKDILYHEAFGCVEKSEPILYCGSSRYLCLDCNMDNFMGIYGIESGKEWEIAFTKA